MRAAIWVVTGTVLVYAGVSFFTTVFCCRPIPSWWEESIPADKCLDFRLKISIVVSALNIFTDFLIFLLPLPGLKRLMLPLSQKIALMAVFAVGFLYVFPDAKMAFF